MGNKDFDSLTSAQMSRDSMFVDSVREALINPLLEELEGAIPGYKCMDEWDRFIALMKLNEDVAPVGDFLMLDFGHNNEKSNMRGAVFTGEMPMILMTKLDGTEVYIPYFQNAQNTPDANILTKMLGAVLVDPDEDYEPFPLPFRVAAIALYLRQNVIVSEVESCRFAAGLTDMPKLSRWIAQPLESRSMQRYGWSLMLRDTRPENEMALHIARALRQKAADDTAWLGEDAKTFYGVVSLYAEYESGKKQTRSRHETTESLVDFIERFLPAHGYHVGRTGEGERLSWEQAMEMFKEQYPKLANKYNSVKSFADSYRNARKARRGE